MLLNSIALGSSPEEKPLYLPENGIALIEYKIVENTIAPSKIHEVFFNNTSYSFRENIDARAKKINQTDVSTVQISKIINDLQQSIESGFVQSEVVEKLKSKYLMTIRFVPKGKQDFFIHEIYFDKKIEKRGKIRDLFDKFLEFEKLVLKK